MISKVNLTLLLIILVLTICSLILGTISINIFETLTDTEKNVIYNLRLPRTITGLVIGATLAGSGKIMQTILRNDLADSSVLGFQSGASLMAMLIILAFPALINFLPLFSFLGGTITFLFLLVLSIKKPGVSNLILIGIAINSIIGALIGILSIIFSDRLAATLFFTNGSLASVTLQEMFNITIYSLPAVLLLLVFQRRLVLFELDDSQIQDLGINLRLSQTIFAIISVYLSAISVAFIGIIGFVGLVAPHITKKITTNINNLVTCMLIGSILVLGCDLLQRVTFIYYELPVGTIMAFIGGLFFLYLLYQKEDYA